MEQLQQKLSVHIHEQFTDEKFKVTLERTDAAINSNLDIASLTQALHDLIIDSSGSEDESTDVYYVALSSLYAGKLMTYKEWQEKIDITQEWNDPQMQFKKYRKVTLTYARELSQEDYEVRGGKVQTLHGLATFEPGDYLARNSVDEWPISRQKVSTCYCLVQPDKDGWSWYQPTDIREAVQMTEPFIVQGVQGKAGDYLVRGGTSEWPVDREVFEREYAPVEEERVE